MAGNGYDAAKDASADRKAHRSAALAASMIVMCFIAFTGITVGFVLWQVSSSQHKWCDTISLLTAVPVPSPTDPANNPSREESYRLYQDFSSLKGRLGCG